MSDPRDVTHFCKCGGGCPNCAASVHPGTDRVELTEDERERLWSVVARNYQPLAYEIVGSIVAARVQALTAELEAERYEWRQMRAARDATRAELAAANTTILTIERAQAKVEDRADALRAELAAANDRIAELTELFGGLRDDYQKACEEVERLQHHGWEDENADLQATLDRVTAVANEHWDWKAGRSLHDALRAALTPEGKP